MRWPRHGAETAAGVWPAIVAAAVFAVTAAPRPASAQVPGAPIHLAKTETIRVTTSAPDPDKWTTKSTLNGTVRVFECKPHACSEPVLVSFTFDRGAVNPPNPKDLEKFATVDLPKTIRAAAAARSVMTDQVNMIETLSSTTATLKNYPAALNETKFTHGRTSSLFLETGVIFASPLIVRVESTSANRALARQSLVDFIETMRIIRSEPQKPQPRGSQSL
jgi:hypothetical protein